MEMNLNWKWTDLKSSVYDFLYSYENWRLLDGSSFSVAKRSPWARPLYDTSHSHWAAGKQGSRLLIGREDQWTEG